MIQITEEDIAKYIDYVDTNLIDIEQVIGHCFFCGEYLNQVELPTGPERRVVCAKDRDSFVKYFEELKDEGEIN
ncbi:hypothetical protein ACYSNU_00010 [Enterococcus sp. LJL120]